MRDITLSAKARMPGRGVYLCVWWRHVRVVEKGFFVEMLHEEFGTGIAAIVENFQLIYSLQ